MRHPQSTAALRMIRWVGFGLTLAGLLSCEKASPTATDNGDARLVLRLAGAPPYVRSIRLGVAGPGISDTLTFGLVPVGGVVADTLVVPAGSNRYIVANAFDSAGANTHRGDTTLTLQPGANTSLHLVMRALDANLPIVITFGDSSSSWEDGFEEYAAASWPSTWIPDGNASSTTQNYVDNSAALGGSHSLHLYAPVGGCWASIAYRAITVTPPFEVSIAVRNGDETLSGCNPYRAEVHLRECCSWTNPARSLVSFDGRAIKAGWAESDSIASFLPLQWDTLRIRYERPSPTLVTLTYWVDGVALGSRSFTPLASEDSLDYLELTVIEGTAWFDDVTVTK